MQARLEIFKTALAPKLVKHLVSAGRVFGSTELPATTRELVNIRASQINGCSGCLDMHTKDAAAAGETSTRLNLVAAWREATVFTEAERAALELTEQGCRRRNVFPLSPSGLDKQLVTSQLASVLPFVLRWPVSGGQPLFVRFS